MALPVGAIIRALAVSAIAAGLAGCASLGMKSPTATTKTVAAANVSPTSVDADIQRILTAGGISPDDPAVAALQTPPPAAAAPGSAWEAGPTAQPPVVQVAAVDPSMSVTNPGVIGVENIGVTDMDQSLAAQTVPAMPVTTTTTAVLPESVGFQPNLQTINPVMPAGGAPGMSLPPSVMAGILPTPDYVVDAITPPAEAPASATVQVASTPRAPQPVVPRIRPANLGGSVAVMAYSAPMPVESAPVAAVMEMTPVVSTPLPPVAAPQAPKTVRRF